VIVILGDAGYKHNAMTAETDVTNPWRKMVEATEKLCYADFAR
jgi:hypothetical protein